MADNRYTTVAIVLHWAIALLIVGQIAGGFYMHNLPNTSAVKFDLYQLHKSFGLTILLLAFARLAWRLTHTRPALPASMSGWQRAASHVTHWAFYALMIATPLVGLALVSVSPRDIPTQYFGVIGVPHFGFLESGADAEDRFINLHKLLAFGILGLLALHVGAALKHAFVDRDGVFASMSPRQPAALLGVGAIFAALGVGALVYTLFGSSAAPAAEDEAMIAASSDGPACPGERLPVNWIIDEDRTALRFWGEQNGRKLAGRFSNFTTEIGFNENDLARSWVRVTIDSSSATTGDMLRDGELAADEWLDVKDHPTAQFLACEIVPDREGYIARGELSVKQSSGPIDLPFMVRISGGEAVANGGVNFSRTDFGLGLASSWLDEEGIGLDVRVEFEVHAAKER
ncbi:MAG: cytochrome b/b6 domain-containing protein [Pseudomonadota bacterium]